MQHLSATTGNRIKFGGGAKTTLTDNSLEVITERNRALANRFQTIDQSSLENDAKVQSIFGKLNSRVGSRHNSKIFEGQNLSVLGIASKQVDKFPNYKTILGQGHGTHVQGSLSRSRQIGTPLGMGSSAGSGIIIGHERSRSVGIAQKKK